MIDPVEDGLHGCTHERLKSRGAVWVCEDCHGVFHDVARRELARIMEDKREERP